MSATLTAIHSKSTISKSLIFDILALAFIYFVPALSHVSTIPLYVLEPMRIMLFVVIAFTSRRNAFVIALTLPLFSFIVTSHPVLPKTLIMTGELLINVWLFYLLSVKLKNYFTAALLSIIISKLVYFAAKYVLIASHILEGSLLSSSVYLQATIMIVLSFYLAAILSRREVDRPAFVDPTKEDF